MKTLLKLLFIVVSVSLLIGCEKTEELVVNNSGELKSAELGADKTHETKMVTVPFKADFLGEYVNFIVGPASECGDFYGCRVFVDFEGTGTHLGTFFGSFEFCACGPEGEYAPTESYMVAANGDMLIVSCGGQVINGRLEDHPEYVTSYWRDPFVILGGTGRFEGATGSGMTDDFNSSEDPNSHHHWVGTITMLKGKMKAGQ